MRGKLFWRLFSAIFAVLLVAVVLFGVFLTAFQQKHLQTTYETEVFVQARQIAEYMHEVSDINSVRGDTTLVRLINKKVNDINVDYNADIWIVNFSRGYISYVDSSWNTGSDIQSEAVMEQLNVIQQGKEIRKTNLFPDLGSDIVTIGTPWTSDGVVVGAVLLHIRHDQLKVSIMSVLPQLLLPILAALIIGFIGAVWVTRSQIKPIREIDQAVTEFSTGDLSRRVELNCGGELEQLGVSINRMAEELSNLEDSRRSFVSNVSHELRSPMTSIKGYIEAILDGTIPPEDSEKYLHVVLDETNRLTDLVRDLLDLSRLESGKFPMAIAPFDANEMMRRSLIRFEQRIENKNIEVNIDFADEPCFAMGDSNRIDQVVSNFTDNAIKFMDGSSSILTLKTLREGRSIRFCVEDNGPGIDPKDLPHIQDRFYKADKAHTVGMGTGLGLSICKNILQQHHSQIEVESAPGRTVFSFTLPAAEARDLPRIESSVNSMEST